MKKLAFLLFICANANLFSQGKFEEIDFGQDLAAKGLYAFILDRQEFADLSVSENYEFRKLANVKKVKVMRYLKSTLPAYELSDGWQHYRTDVLSCDRNGIIIDWRRSDTVQEDQVMQVRTTKDSVIQVYKFSKLKINCAYYKGCLVKKSTSLIEKTDWDLDWAELQSLAHLPVTYRYTADHRLLKIQHCCHAKCSYELHYSYPAKGITLISYLVGEGKTAIAFENKQVYDEQGNLIRTSFRRVADPGVMIRYLLKYDREGNLKEVLRQTEDADAVREETWLDIRSIYENNLVVRREVQIKTNTGYAPILFSYDAFGRVSEIIDGHLRYVYSYNGKASEE